MGYEEKPPIEEVMDELYHYGIKRRSGRYPWGSGDDPYQHDSRDFLGRIEELKKNGWKETPENIKKEFGLTTSQYRAEKSIAKNNRRMLQVATAKSLSEDGLGPTEIGRKMGINESTVRSLLNPESEKNMNSAMNTANFLRDQVKEKGMIDVTSGVEIEMGVSKERLNQALNILKREGYEVYKGGIPQVTNPGKQTNQKVLCPPGTQHKEIYNLENVHTITEYASRDGGETFSKFIYPESMDSKRLMIRYDEDGGSLKDGIVELRRGVDDLSLGDSRYSQVRILVDGKKYIKGVAVYSDDMPDGVDVIFNTNKTKNVAKMDVLKDIKDDPDNPFGSLIKPNGQSMYDDPNGKYTDPITGKKQSLSLINKRADQGDWEEWTNALPSQFLGKQSYGMAKKQLDLAKADKMAEFDEICSLNNPTVKKHLLEKFSDNCDSAAIHLKAAALPGQRYHVIIPVNSLKDNEVYAPNYENGTKLALIRYPHGGTFEIPILTVNNKHKPAEKIIGADSIDAIGITKKNADRLSGADFDGDTVMCIPTHDRAGKVKITSTPELEDLKGFDPKLKYGVDRVEKDAEGVKHAYIGDREIKLMSKNGTQQQMGVISNLITDMTLAGANQDELARAVSHSMVVIDAHKHNLDYKQSEIDNDISGLKKKYQIHIDKNGNERAGGASTILSRAKGQYTTTKKQGTPHINIKGSKDYDPTRPEGALIYKNADDLYYPVRRYDKSTGMVTLRTTDGKKITYDINDAEARKKYEPVGTKDPKTGKTVYGEVITNKAGDISYKVDFKKQKSTNMAETDNAMDLVSKARHPIEVLYAEHANYMKALANKARLEVANTGKIAYDKTAKKIYAAEVKSLNDKLKDALKNAPRERAAQRKANVEVNEKIKTSKEEGNIMTKADIKKAGQMAITKYRNDVGSISRRDRNIEITDKEWEAIQAGAISESRLKSILDNTDIDKLKERATPRVTTTLSTAKMNKIKRMSDSNYTLSEIAEACGVSTSTVAKYMKGAN